MAPLMVTTMSTVERTTSPKWERLTGGAERSESDFDSSDGDIELVSF